jgi:hypothetical protein
VRKEKDGSEDFTDASGLLLCPSPGRQGDGDHLFFHHYGFGTIGALQYLESLLRVFG